MKKKVVILTGAGVSAESGISTFRDSGGLWEGYDVNEVATMEGWHKNPEKVLRFYNERRVGAMNAKPNPAHQSLVELEKIFDTTIITQNVDDLHERAGSKNVLHLHGELKLAKSSVDDNLVYELDAPYQINLGDLCEKGSQLRPNIVWFGELVPMIEPAMQLCTQADMVIVVGTSMVVYPAAGLLQYVPDHAPIYVVDPVKPEMNTSRKIEFIQKKASIGVPELVYRLKKK